MAMEAIVSKIPIQDESDRASKMTMRALHELLCLPQSTSKAVPYKQWSHPTIVHVESDMEACMMYLDCDACYDIVDALS